MNDTRSVDTIDPDAGITELETDICTARHEFGDTVEAMSSSWREITLVGKKA